MTHCLATSAKDSTGLGAIDTMVAHLVASGGLTTHALERGRRASEMSSERLDQVLLKLGLIEERTMVEAWSATLRMPVVASQDFPDAAILTETLPHRFLKSAGALPLSVDDDCLRVAVSDPFDTYTIAAIATRTGFKVTTWLAEPSDIERCLARLFPEDDRSGHAHTGSSASSETASDDITRLHDLATDAPAIRYVEAMIERAVDWKASDIHLAIGSGRPRLRLRIDGVLRDLDPPPPDLYQAVLSRLKILADLDIAEKRLPQDGRIRLGIAGREIDLRIATMPHLDGEGAVLRILDRTSVKLELASLGFEGPIEQALLQVLDQPHGILLVTGPTGSGKTTTLYAALRHLVKPECNIVSVEDPVEYQLDGVAQVQVQRKIGLDFPTVLRAVLRQDPDVIMVGEIRDNETAAIANQAALTGHFVLATLHTNSAAASLPRLIDMGLEPYLLATTVRGVLAQRLVRRLCRRCAQPVPRPATELTALRRICPALDAEAGHIDLRRDVGCARCDGTGFSGRVAVAELLTVDDAIRQAILNRADAISIDQIARKGGLRPIAAAGAARVLSGETTLSELVRISGQTVDA